MTRPAVSYDELDEYLRGESGGAKVGHGSGGIVQPRAE